MSRNYKSLRAFVFIILVIFLVNACQPTDFAEPLPLATATQPAKPTAAASETPTPSLSTIIQPTIALDYKTLKGHTISLSHPFIDQEVIINQLVREFNLSNVWGLHVTSTTQAGYYDLAQSLLNQTNNADMIIGMGSDLAAAEPVVNWFDLAHFSNDPQYGISNLYAEEGVFGKITSQLTGNESLNSLPIAFNPGLIYYNQGWAEELGQLEPPTTQEQLLQLAKTAANVNANDGNILNNGTGGLWLSQSSLSALSWYASMGGQFGDPEDGYLPDDEILIASFSDLKDAFLEDETWIGVDSVAYRYFSDRYAIAYEGNLLDLPFQTAYQSEGAYQDNWISLPYLNAEGQANLVLEPLSFAIQSNNEKSQLAAYIFGRWLLEPEQQEKLVSIHGLWPATGNPADIASAFANANPAWQSALDYDPTLIQIPLAASWAQTQLVFQDAYQRVYNLDAQYFPSILEVFKETLRINLEQRP